MERKGQAASLAIGGTLFIVLVIILAMGFDKVDARHYGVQDRFGVVKEEVLSPGLHWTGVFTKTVEFPYSTQSINIKRSEAVDKGGQDVFANIAVNLHVKDKNAARELYKTVGKHGDYQQILNLAPRIEEGFKQITVKYDALEILEKRDEVKDRAEERIKASIPGEYFEVETVIISNIGFQESFSNAIQAKKDAEQRALEAEENVKRAIHEKESAIQVAQGEAEALKLQKAQVTPELIQLRMVERWNGQMPLVVMTGGDSEASPLFDVSSLLQSRIE